MNIGFQQLFVALVMLVPGFIATNIQRAFAPRRFSSDLVWTVTSLLISVVLNLLLGCIAIIYFHNIDVLSLPITEAASRLKGISTWETLAYIVVLYLSAVVWGLLSGAFQKFRFRALLNRLHLIPFAEHPSVWDRVFAVRVPLERPITWLKLRLDDERVIIGHLRHSSEYIDKDQPFEIYLDQIHEWDNADWKPVALGVQGEGADGIYLRLLASQPAEFYFRERGWMPTMGIQANTRPQNNDVGSDDASC